jgi:glycosyltransferase involved in cell wall biosynthesis
MPAITIGMPVYNGEQYLVAALENLLEQTFTDFEIIISDNCSTDGTVTVIKDFAARDDRIRLACQASNIGALANFSFVLEQANSKYFLWRACDDVSDPNYLETLFQALQDAPHCALSTPTVVRKRMDGAESARIKFPDVTTLSSKNRVRCLLRNASAGWMYGLFRRADLVQSFANANVGFPYPWAQDHLIVLRFILNDQVTGSNATTFYHLETGTSAEAYRPQSLGERWCMTWIFLRYAFRELSASRLTGTKRLALILTLFRYTDGKTDRYRRLIYRAVAWPFRRLIAAVLANKADL